MSGGHWNYIQYRLDNVVEDIKDIIDNNGSGNLDQNDDCYVYGNWPDDIIDKFKETANTLDKASRMIHRLDWLLSGDDGEDSFRKRWEEEIEKRGEI